MLNRAYLRFCKKQTNRNRTTRPEGILADWTIQKDENPEVEKWLLYGENSARFQQNRTLGNQLSSSILTNLKTRNGSLYQQLITLTGIPKVELDKYEILDEIPLNTSGGYMKADIMFIKRNVTDEFLIDNVIIIENKLSQNTDLTERQKEGFGAILGGKPFMNVTFPLPQYNLPLNQSMPVSKDKIFKFYDHGKNDLSKVTIIKITSIN